MFIRFDMIHEHDRRQTDRQTPHADLYRAYAYASRGKNEKLNFRTISVIIESKREDKNRSVMRNIGNIQVHTQN